MQEFVHLLEILITVVHRQNQLFATLGVHVKVVLVTSNGAAITFNFFVVTKKQLSLIFTCDGSMVEI
jgi:DNA mismatch repair protein MutH